MIPAIEGSLAALRDNVTARRHFFLANQGMVPRESFFNEQNLQSLLGENARRTA